MTTTAIITASKPIIIPILIIIMLKVRYRHGHYQRDLIDTTYEHITSISPQWKNRLPLFHIKPY